MSNNLSANVRRNYGLESLAAPADRQFVIAQQMVPHPQLRATKKNVGGSFRNCSIIPEGADGDARAGRQQPAHYNLYGQDQLGRGLEAEAAQRPPKT